MGDMALIGVSIIAAIALVALAQQLVKNWRLMDELNDTRAAYADAKRKAAEVALAQERAMDMEDEVRHAKRIIERLKTDREADARTIVNQMYRVLLWSKIELKSKGCRTVSFSGMMLHDYLYDAMIGNERGEKLFDLDIATYIAKRTKSRWARWAIKKILLRNSASETADED